MKNFILESLNTLKLQKEFYIVAAFSKANKDRNYIINNINNIICSTQIVPYTSISHRAVTRLEFFNLNNMNLYIVKGYTGLVKPIHSSISDHTTDALVDRRINIIDYTYPLFFTEINLKNIFESNSFDLDNTYFLFHQTLWLYIVSLFRMFNYQVQGGNLTLRHMWSPVQEELAKFMFTFELKAARGFHSKFNPILASKIDYTSEAGKEHYETIKKII